MPHVRNFWVDLLVDGRCKVATGPRSADGGFSLVVLMREEGSISERRVRVNGFARSDGLLSLEIAAEGGDVIPGDKPGEFMIRTRRDAAKSIKLSGVTTDPRYHDGAVIE